MNPTITKDFLDGEFKRNPSSYASEYMAEFRSDIGEFVSRERVEAVVIRDRRELPLMPNIQYVGFVDSSGGSASSMAVAIAHRNADGIATLDCVRETLAPFSPDAATQESASLLKSYGIHRVIGDNFGGRQNPH